MSDDNINTLLTDQRSKLGLGIYELISDLKRLRESAKIEIERLQSENTQLRELLDKMAEACKNNSRSHAVDALFEIKAAYEAFKKKDEK